MNFIQIIIFLTIYVFGTVLVIWWRKRTADPDTFFFVCCWTLIALMSYLAFLEINVGSFYLSIPLLFLAIFLFSYFQKKSRLLNGLLFNVFALFFGFYLVYNVMQTKNILVAGLLLLVLLGFILIAALGLFGLIVFLYGNAMIVLRKESRSLANLLTLLLAIVLTFMVIINYFKPFFPDWFASLVSILPAILFYFFIVFLNFLSISVIYQFNHPRYQQDFILVLGAGLIDGERVTPLLAKRIDKAIEFYHLQRKKKDYPSKILMSGGQGTDEKIAEALAMKNYALEQGIPEEDILVEVNSTTTYENMKFSKEIMDKLKPDGFRAIFTSNNYHIFRAAIYADAAGLKADGIGAKTALYYLPNAFLREYIAIVMMHKKRHLIIVSLIALLNIGIAILTYYSSYLA